MVLSKLREHLDANGVKYIVIAHSQAFTAQEIAEVAHIPGREIAKTVMLKLDGRMVMAVVPASDMVDFKTLRRMTGSNKIELASEEEFRALFPGCRLDLRRSTLAPPIVRRLVPLSWATASVLERLQILNTHCVGLITRS